MRSHCSTLWQRSEEISYVSGATLTEKTGLDAGRINDAMSVLVDAGLAEWLQVMGTAPYDFGEATITARGRYERQRAIQAAKRLPAPANQTDAIAAVAATRSARRRQSDHPTDSQMKTGEIVAERKGQQSQLRVVLGYQFESQHYETEKLRTNVKASFEAAIAEYHARQMGPAISLKFKVLGAGYGEHLFNEIARDIISADIAVFDASDLNPNVMLEMGVALTWDRRTICSCERNGWAARRSSTRQPRGAICSGSSSTTQAVFRKHGQRSCMSPGRCKRLQAADVSAGWVGYHRAPSWSCVVRELYMNCVRWSVMASLASQLLIRQTSAAPPNWWLRIWTRCSPITKRRCGNCPPVSLGLDGRTSDRGW